MDYSIQNQIITNVPEHQILLSFLNDDDAVKFYVWWNKMGHQLFDEYVEKEE